ncbi:transposase [Candidatus Woesearchaeota archaeon]|nr:transposase [Candidatus Woesearchaeota archaeon]
MILARIKEVIKNLSFSRKAFTKQGFRHVNNYVSGLIALSKKTAKKITEACPDEKHSSALSRILTEAKFEKESFEKRYLKKIRFLFGNFAIYLLFDDTIVERNGKFVEETQKHFDHSTNEYVQGHQFFTAILYTPFLQLPLFPELYSKNTDSKIEMAKKLISKLIHAKIQIHTVLFDSWYSDKNLIKTCLKASIRVICAIKTNRKVRFFKARNYKPLSLISQQTRVQKLHEYKVGDKIYDIWSKEVYLNKLPLMRLVISHERIDGKLSDNVIHLISTDIKNRDGEILQAYKIRWRIETYHRDIKQNLGFAKVFFRKKEGIVRHAIFVAIAYAVLSLFMYAKGMVMTIGTCCEYLRDKADIDLITEIIEIEEKAARQKRFEEVFIS